jgi:DNA polymerase-3 subunit delta
MNFKQADIDRYLKAPDPAIRCVLIFGTNEGMMSGYVRDFTASVSPDVTDAFRVSTLEMSALEDDFGALYGEFNARALTGGRRVVIVRNVNNDLTAPLKKMLESSTSDTLLILVSSSLSTKSSLVVLAKNSPIFAHIGCYDDREGDLRKVASDYLVRQSVTITPEALQMLVSRLSADRQATAGELEKLVTYLGTRRHIEADDVRLVISDTSDSSFEDLCYLTASGRRQQALEAYAELLHHGEEPAAVVRSLIGHFMRLLEALAALKSGMDFKSYLDTLHPKIMFYRTPELQRQLQIWDKTSLIGALEKLQDCERDCKTTGYPADDIVGFALLSLSGAAVRLAVSKSVK